MYDFSPLDYLSELAEIKIFFPQELRNINTSECPVKVLSTDVIQPGIECEVLFDILEDSNKDPYLHLTNLFYAQGYDGQRDGPIQLMFPDLILGNPDSAYNELMFGIETWDQYDGLSLVDVDRQISVKNFATAGELKNLKVDLDNSTTDSRSTLTIDFANDHRIPKNGAVSLKLPADFRIDPETLSCKSNEGSGTSLEDSICRLLDNNQIFIELA